MKKITSIFAIAVITILTTNNPVSAQNHNDAIALNLSLFSDDGSAQTNNEDLTHTKRNNINIKAVRDFTRSFKNATNVKWYTISEGFIARFKQNEIETRVAYNQRGRWQSTLLTYDEKKLPLNIRNLVKSKYYDFNILLAQEIHQDKDLVYFLKLEDGRTFKTLTVYDGEIKVFADFTKD